MAKYSLSCLKSLVFFSILLCAGCGGSGLVPVSGKVLNGDEQLKEGTVTFYPHSEKGNTSGKTAVGEIVDGKYTVYTRSEAGVAPGWYKVTVMASTPTPDEASGDVDPEPETLVAEEYSEESKTPLTIEVKADAPEGHYDLKLEKK